MQFFLGNCFLIESVKKYFRGHLQDCLWKPCTDVSNVSLY